MEFLIVHESILKIWIKITFFLTSLLLIHSLNRLFICLLMFLQFWIHFLTITYTSSMIVLCTCHKILDEIRKCGWTKELLLLSSETLTATMSFPCPRNSNHVMEHSLLPLAFHRICFHKLTSIVYLNTTILLSTFSTNCQDWPMRWRLWGGRKEPRLWIGNKYLLVVIDLLWRNLVDTQELAKRLCGDLRVCFQNTSI